MDDTYFRDTLYDLYQKWAYEDDVLKYRKLLDDHDFYKLINPGVNVIAMIMRDVKTPIALEWDVDILKEIKRKKIAKPKFIKGTGDGTININSLLYGPLKWAFEFDQN